MNQAVALEEQTFNVPPVDTGDRLSFTFFVAIILHAFVLLGIGFKMPEHKNTSQTIDITLATHKSLREPKEADFLAQHNQEGSGTLDEAKQLTTERQAQFADTQVRDVNPLLQQRSAIKQISEKKIITTSANSDSKSAIKEDPDQQDQLDPNKSEVDSPSQYDPEIASLQAKIDRQRQEAAKRPRLRVINSVSTKESFDARYLNSWSTKIEKISESNYPKEALNRHITGILSLSVIINADGSVHEIKVLRSSGQRILDDAARQIVRRSAPFESFSKELRQHADRLQIIRTWHFEITGQKASITTSAN